MPSVMIIDDHHGFVDTVRRLLAADGFDVVGEAFDGATGVALVEQVRPDVVLLDVQLPDIDGFEVARQLETLDPAPTVVMTSTRDADDYGVHLDHAPVRGFIGKGELSAARLTEVVSQPV